MLPCDIVGYPSDSWGSCSLNNQFFSTYNSGLVVVPMSELCKLWVEYLYKQCPFCPSQQCHFTNFTDCWSRKYFFINL